MGKAREIFIIIDKKLNFISGGSRNNTISGRVGYYANHSNIVSKLYWKVLQFIINLTFYPFDNFGHCNQAYLKDITKEDYFPTKNVISFFLLSLFTTLSCSIIILPFYLAWLFGAIKQTKI